MGASDPQFVISVTRLCIQQDAGRIRTYGSYSVQIGDDEPGGLLSGFVCESHGPGDNGASGVLEHCRIAPGTYQLSTHFGRYVSKGFQSDQNDDPDLPLPGFQLLGTGHRTNILIHPGHKPTLYLSSIGCLNLTGPLAANQEMDPLDSRRRVVAVIEALKQFSPNSFQTNNNTKIPDASVVVTDALN